MIHSVAPGLGFQLEEPVFRPGISYAPAASTHPREETDKLVHRALGADSRKGLPLVKYWIQLLEMLPKGQY